MHGAHERDAHALGELRCLGICPIIGWEAHGRPHQAPAIPPPPPPTTTTTTTQVDPSVGVRKALAGFVAEVAGSAAGLTPGMAQQCAGCIEGLLRDEVRSGAVRPHMPARAHTGRVRAPGGGGWSGRGRGGLGWDGGRPWRAARATPPRPAPAPRPAPRASPCPRTGDGWGSGGTPPTRAPAPPAPPAPRRPRRPQRPQRPRAPPPTRAQQAPGVVKQAVLVSHGVLRTTLALAAAQVQWGVMQAGGLGCGRSGMCAGVGWGGVGGEGGIHAASRAAVALAGERGPRLRWGADMYGAEEPPPPPTTTAHHATPHARRALAAPRSGEAQAA